MPTSLSKLRWFVAIRENVRQWFQGFGYFCDERTRLPVRGRANVLQRRMFAYYRWCFEHNKPCRMVVLKYRRAGSSTASAAILYTHSQNHHARLGVIGTDYKASSNMLAMIEHFGRHDHFPGWDTNGDWSENQSRLPQPKGEATSFPKANSEVRSENPSVAGGNRAERDSLPRDCGAVRRTALAGAGNRAVASSQIADWSENQSYLPQPRGEATSFPETNSDLFSENLLHPEACNLHPGSRNPTRSENPFEKNIATRIEWPHGSSVELYTASNPESARSAGLNGYHATECGRWPAGGQLDAGETITSMRNALPKSGFHVAIEESTANGAQGAFWDTCRTARWPDCSGAVPASDANRGGAANSGEDQGPHGGTPLSRGNEGMGSRDGCRSATDFGAGTAPLQQGGAAPWWHQWQSDWPLEPARFAPDLQFVFIFAAWFEDERHVERLTPQEAKDIEDTVDGAAWYDGERELIARFGQEGPRGLRLGGEVDATVWEQLAWRRGIIAHVCTRRGLEEFKQEYPSNPLEAFRSSGSPVFDPDGLIALEEMRRKAPPVQFGDLEMPRDGHWTSVTWRAANERAATVWRWEEPVTNGRYLIAVDTKENSEIIKGSGNLDRNAVLVLRDAWQDERRVWHPVKLVARVAAPNQWDDAPLARLIAPLAKYYGDCMIVVENNKGLALITRLRDEHGCQLYCSEHWDAVRQTKAQTYGWRTDEGSRRQMVSTGQEYIRDERLELLDAHAIAELKTFVFNSHGKATAASGAHDDDVIALLMGLCCLHTAVPYPQRRDKPAPFVVPKYLMPDNYR